MAKSISRSFIKLLRPLRALPFHPQWHVSRYSQQIVKYVREHVSGLILDVGCGRMEISRMLTPGRHHYVGLDYPATSIEWYGTRPHVYADGERLPIRSASVDVVLALNVLEHLRDPFACLTEIRRVLKDGGRCLLEVPFLYPIHDAPRDFSRWTQYGLEELLREHALSPESIVPFGRPPETGALLLNLSLSERVMRFWTTRSPLVVLLPLTLPVFLLVNIVSLLFAAVWRSDFMPYSYWIVAVKRAIPSNA
jgi:SAM-dependent methyltransferase